MLRPGAPYTTRPKAARTIRPHNVVRAAGDWRRGIYAGGALIRCYWPSHWAANGPQTQK
jgi:hypothetical protein